MYFSCMIEYFSLVEGFPLSCVFREVTYKQIAYISVVIRAGAFANGAATHPPQIIWQSLFLTHSFSLNFYLIIFFSNSLYDFLTSYILF